MQKLQYFQRGNYLFFISVQYPLCITAKFKGDDFCKGGRKSSDFFAFAGQSINIVFRNSDPFGKFSFRDVLLCNDLI